MPGERRNAEGIVEIDQIRTVGLRLKSHSFNRPVRPSDEVGIDQVRTVGLRLSLQTVEAEVVYVVVGIAQVRTVGLRREGEVVHLLLGRDASGLTRLGQWDCDLVPTRQLTFVTRSRVGIDQVGKVGLRLTISLVLRNALVDVGID